MSPITYLRRVAKPTGRHRAESPASPEPLMRPEEAMVNDVAWCPVEQRETLHAFRHTGGRICWTCRTLTPHDKVPPGGVDE